MATTSMDMVTHATHSQAEGRYAHHDMSITIVARAGVHCRNYRDAFNNDGIFDVMAA